MMIYLIVLLSVVLTASAQILLKTGMSSAAVQHAIGEGRIPPLIWEIACSPAILFGFALYGISVVTWLVVLSRIEVSRAYPFVGLGVVITMLFGTLMLGEPLTLTKILGTILVATGVYVVATA